MCACSECVVSSIVLHCRVFLLNIPFLPSSSGVGLHREGVMRGDVWVGADETRRV